MKKYNVTLHAVERVVERIGQPEHNAANYLIQLMQTAVYNGEASGEDGRVAKIYDNYKHRVRMIVGEGDCIVTVYKLPDKLDSRLPVSEVPAFLRDKVAQVVNRELAKFESAERKIERRNTLYKAELEIEVAELNLRLLRARSETTKMALQSRIQAVQMRIDELVSEINEVKRDKSMLAKGVAAYV